MECFLAPRRTRRFLQCLSFGAIAVWIIIGAYVRHEEPGQQSSNWMAGGEGGGGPMSRHLLSVQDLGSVSPQYCASLNMTYATNNQTTAVNLADDQCSQIHHLDSNFTSCDFVQCVEGCGSEDGILNYLHFIYCVMPHKLIPLAMILLFLWLIFLFVFLGATAEEYFCPALTVISSVLRLSQNVAGVTLLALGNGAPDIFSAFAAVNQKEDEKASLAVGALFGAGIFVTTIVVGAVTVTRPFMLTQRPFLRDIIFYIFAAFWTFYLLWSNKMDIFNAVGLVALYVVYVVVVILGRVIYQRWKKWRNKGKLGTGDMPRAPSPPEGREMDHSNATSSKTSRIGGLASSYGALLPGVGITGSYSQTPNGHAGINAEGEEDKKEEEGKGKEGGEASASEKTKKTDSEPKLFRISSIRNSELSTSVGPVVNMPIIRVQGDPDSPNSESSPLFPRANAEERRREKELAQASLPPLLHQAGQDSPQQQRMGSSVGAGGGYGAIPVSLQTDSDTTPSPTRRRKMRKTISGALDVTEGVGAVFAIPHVPELWEEVNRTHSHSRSHSRSRASSYRASRSRTHSTRSTTHTETMPSTDDHTPLLGPTLTVPTVIPGQTPTMQVQDEDTEHMSSSESDEDEESAIAPVLKLGSQRMNPLKKMLLAFWPFGESFMELGLLGKLYEIVKSPAGFLLTLTVPVIDTNEDDHNWNKWLNVLHCVTAPVFISLITKLGLINIGGVFPVWTLILLIFTGVGIVVACTSKSEKPPIYHCVFAWVGFAVSVVWIYSIANEIVNLLQAFGVVIKLSDGILGLTLLAWGNSIGDAVSNVTMAKQGFPRMAIGACFGGPLLNMLLGIGIASVVKTIRSKGLQYKLFFTQVEMLAALFLLGSLLCTLITVSVLKFRMRRPYGIFLVSIYVVFLTVAILAEAKVFEISIPGVLE